MIYYPLGCFFAVATLATIAAGTSEDRLMRRMREAPAPVAAALSPFKSDSAAIDEVESVAIPKYRSNSEASNASTATSDAGQLVEQVAMPFVIWGIETNSNAAYEKIVETQLATWAQTIPREQLVIVGGKFDDATAAVSQAPMDCDDGPRGLPCKEALLLDRGIERARSLGADWLMVGQEDKYVWRSSVQRALSLYDAAEPRVIGSFGCGQPWAFQRNSQNGTLPMPPGWVEPAPSCNAVHQNGGLCGGPVYYVSRGALSMVKRQGQTTKDFVAEFVSGASGNHANSDQLASCLFYARGIPIIVSPLGSIELGTMDAVAGLQRNEFLTSAHINVPKDSIPKAIEDLHLLKCPSGPNQTSKTAC